MTVDLKQPLGESFGVEDDPAFLHLARVDFVSYRELGIDHYVTLFPQGTDVPLDRPLRSHFVG
jgi:hypothetical protein